MGSNMQSYVKYHIEIMPITGILLLGSESEEIRALFKHRNTICRNSSEFGRIPSEYHLYNLVHLTSRFR